MSGIMKATDSGLKRAFDFKGSTVPEELKNPDSIRLDSLGLRVSGDGTFYTLQGEGVTMGMPAVFLRLHLCNLRCEWCDAWYTWNPKTTEFWTESRLWSLEATKKAIEDNWGAPAGILKRLIVTGGEPLLQQKPLTELFKSMPEWTIEIETNGTIVPNEDLLKRCQFNCSPKLSNSGNPNTARIKPEVIKALKNVNTYFKFVVMTDKDVNEIERDYVVPFGIEPSKVILMPQGVTAEEVRSNAKSVVEIAKAKGYRLLSRLQVEIWGARRKV